MENQTDLALVKETKAAMGDKPVVVLLSTTRPVVMEFEPWADAILVAFGVRSAAYLDIVTGSKEPYGLLPMQFPIDMNTVEEQFEDTPHDMIPYLDACGNRYDFAFGMNWSGVIDDARVKKYKK
ncbi:MAG: glycoside hydrolase family 3 C-terminal domain-containing protein [Lachnospiraceae bacterium]|nr:glycoside hydrolase family 3 C-terminal domain-containing protein [Lachnospiraceae bacterium]